MAFSNSLTGPGLGPLTAPSYSYGGFPIAKEKAASPTFSATIEQPWFLRPQPHMLQGTAVPLSSAVEGNMSSEIPISLPCGPTLLERFYAVHRILDASQRLSSRLELRETPPEVVEKGTRAVVPVIFPLRPSADLSAAEEQQVFSSVHQQAVGSRGAGEALEASALFEEKKSKVNVDEEPFRRKSHKKKRGEEHRASVGAGSSALAANTKDAAWDTTWYDREFRRNLKKERELVASKVRLIEEAWIEHMRSKRQLEQYQRTSERVAERRDRNERMQRLAADLHLDSAVAAAFSAANADSLLQAQGALQSPVKRRSGSQVVAAAVALDTCKCCCTSAAAVAAAAIAEVAAAATAVAAAVALPTLCALIMKKVAPQVKEDLRRQEEERAKREFLEALAATKIQAAYRGFYVRKSIALRVPDVQFKPSACSLSKKSSKGQYWWQHAKMMGAASYWELLLDLKVQALASRLKAPEADRQLAAEAAALAKKLEEARLAPHKFLVVKGALAPVIANSTCAGSTHCLVSPALLFLQPFKASAAKILVTSPTATSSGAHVDAGHSPADAAYAGSPSQEGAVDAREHKPCRKLQTSSPHHKSMSPAAPREVDAKAAKLPAGVCRESVKSGYEATPADVIAFRASALAVRSLGPHRVRSGLKGKGMVKGSACRESLRDSTSEGKQMRKQGAAGQEENHRPTNLPFPGTEQTLTCKDVSVSSALRQPDHAYALPDTQKAIGGKHDVDDDDALVEASEIRSAEAAKLQLRSERTRFQRHQQQMAATMKQAVHEGYGQPTPRHQLSESTLRQRDVDERMQQAKYSAGGRLSWDAGAARDSLPAEHSPATGLEEPTDGRALGERSHATEQKQADGGVPSSSDADLPLVVVHRYSSGAEGPPPRAVDLTDASEATARNRQMLVTLSEREMSQREKRLSERRSAAASRRSSPSQQTPRAEVAAEEAVGKAELPSGAVDLEAVRQALLESMEAENEDVQPKQLSAPGDQEEGVSRDVTSSADAAGSSIKHRVAEEPNLALAHVLARQKEMAVEAGEKAAALRAKRLTERRSAASSRLQTPRVEASAEESVKPERSLSNAVDAEAVSHQALSNARRAEGEKSPPAQPPSTGVQEAAPSEGALGITDTTDEPKHEQAVARELVRSRQRALGLEAGELAAAQRAKRLEERRSAAATRRGSVRQTPRRDPDNEGGAELRLSAIDLEAVSQALLKDKGAETELGAPPEQPAPSGVKQEPAASEDASSNSEPAEDSTYPVVPSDSADVVSANLRAHQEELLSALGERIAAQREKRLHERRSEAATRLQTPRGVPADELSSTAQLSSKAVDLQAASQVLLKDEKVKAEQPSRVRPMPPSPSKAEYERCCGSPDPATGSGSTEQLLAEERSDAALAQLRARQKDLASTMGELVVALQEKRLSERRSEAATRIQTPRGVPSFAGSAGAAPSGGAVKPQAVSQALVKDEAGRIEASRGIVARLLNRDEAESAGEEGEGAAASAAGSGSSQEPVADAEEDSALAQLRVRQKDLASTLGELAAAQREKRLNERRPGALTSLQAPRQPVGDGHLGNEQSDSGAVDLQSVKKALESDQGSATDEAPSLQSLPHEEDEAVHEDVRDNHESAEILSEQGLLGDELADIARTHVLARQKEMLAGVEERAAAQRAKRLSERRSAASSRLHTPRGEASGEASAKAEPSPSGAFDVGAVGQALLDDKGAEGKTSPPTGFDKKLASVNGGCKALSQGPGDQEEEKLTSEPSSAVAAGQHEIQADLVQQGASSSAQTLVRTGSPDKQLEVRSEHPAPNGSPPVWDHTFRPLPEPHAVDLAAVSAALLHQRGSSGSLEEERDSKALHRPSRTPVWGRTGASKPTSGEGSLASPASPVGQQARSSPSVQEKQSIEPHTKALQRMHRVEANEGDWVRHQEVLISAMHRHAAARVIQHAWRRKRLANLFHAVLEMRRRRERRASQSRRSPSVAPFSDRARDIINRLEQLSFRPENAKSITDLGKALAEEKAQPPQFVPIVEGGDDPSAAVVLFNGKRGQIESKRRASDNVQSQQASSRQPTRSSSDSFPHLSNTGSQGSARSERLPAIVLRRASRGALVSSESSSESAWSSSESDSEDEDPAAVSRRGARDFEASTDFHEDDFDMQQRLRRIVREGLDAKMRSTVEGSSVLLPKSRRGQQEASTSSVSAEQDQVFDEGSSRRDQEDRMLSSDSEKPSLIQYGQKSPRGQTQKKRYQQEPHPQKTASSSGAQRQSGFLSPDWQGGSVRRGKQRQAVPAELAGEHLCQAATSAHHDKLPMTSKQGQQRGQAKGDTELRTGDFSCKKFAEDEQKPEVPVAHEPEGGDTSREQAGALQRPNRSSAKEEGCRKCQNEGHCFCGLSAKDAVCEDKASFADALPRSPRKRSPREFGGPPALVR
ncbi:hypothetical protein Emag_001678 [Eimeria magna]